MQCSRCQHENSPNEILGGVPDAAGPGLLELRHTVLVDCEVLSELCAPGGR